MPEQFADYEQLLAKLDADNSLAGILLLALFGRFRFIRKMVLAYYEREYDEFLAREKREIDEILEQLDDY